MKKKLAAAVLGALMFNPAVLPQNNFLPAPVVCAEIRTIEADGYYIMGDGMEENQGVAKERAREDAKRAASEQACTFIESISEIKNGSLTRDEIRTFSATVLEIIDAPVQIESNGDSMVFHCRMIAKVDTDNVMAKLHQNRQELDEVLRQTKELSDKIEQLNSEMKNLRDRYKNASETERAEINAEVKQNEAQLELSMLNKNGCDYINSKDYNKAIECFNKVIELNPTFDVAWNNLGVAYKSAGNYQKAVECYNKAVELNPKNNVTWIDLGVSYIKLSNYIKAIECLNKATEVYPNNDDIWNNLGFSYKQLKNYNKSLDCYNKSVEINPQNDHSWVNLGWLYWNERNYAKSLDCYGKACELKPQNATYRKWYQIVFSKVK